MIRIEPANSLRVALSVAALLSAGCALPTTLPTLKGPQPIAKAPAPAVAPGAYDAASVTYRLDAKRLNLPLEVMRIDHQQVSYDQVASTPSSASTSGTLSLDYPHPEAPPGYARAKVTISSGSILGSSKPKDYIPGWHYGNKPMGAQQVQETVEVEHPSLQEVWVLDLPKAEFDQALEALRRQNYFNPGDGVAGGAELSTKIGGRELKKPWVQVPEFDVLMQRVRRDGQLISYTRPALAARVAPASGLAAMGPPAVQPFAVDPRVPAQPNYGAPIATSAPANYGPPANNPTPPNAYSQLPVYAQPAPYGAPAQNSAPPAYGPPAEMARGPATIR